MEININEIASSKIKEMEESGEIRKRIEDGVEKTVNEAIDSACKSYNFRNGMNESISALLSEVAKEVSFSAYANFLRDRMNEQIERYVKGDMINLMRDSFEKMYFNMPEDIKLSDILAKYKEYLVDNLDLDDKKAWGRIDLSVEKQYSMIINVKAGRPNQKRYDTLSKGVEISLHKSRENKATIAFIRFDGDNFQTTADLNRLSNFEILMFNLMFTQKEIEVDIDEDFCFDADFESEEDEGY